MDLKNKFKISKQYLSSFIDPEQSEKIEVISTGNFELDKALGVNGIPKAKITEIYGNEASGKTTVALQIAKQAQENNGKVLYLDYECSLNIQYLKQIGINFENFLISQPKYGEIGFGIIEEALIDDSFDLIIVDSVAGMISESEYLTKADEQNTLGTHARMMSKGLRKIQNPLNRSKTALVFINQIREKIGIFFGNPETTTGGRALRYFASLRLEVKKVDLIKSGQDKIGIKSKISIVKNKLAKPYETTFINIYFGDGYDEMQDIIEFAINQNIIEKNGSWFYFNNEKICQGRKQLVDFLKENSEIFQEIKTTSLSVIKS